MMKTDNQDIRRKSYAMSNFIVTFNNPAHLMDSIVYLRELGLVEKFWERIGYVCQMFVVDATQRKAEDDAPTIVLTFFPDSPTRPSFAWGAKRQGGKQYFNGAMLFNEEDKNWSIHT